MNLLKIDNKLIALHLDSHDIYNITDNLSKHTIRKIVFDRKRFVILTVTNLYYLYYHKYKFTLIDVTDDVITTVDIGDIKFVTNSYYTQSNHHFGIITYSNKAFMCKVKKHIFGSIDFAFSLDNKNVVAITDEQFGYIHDTGNGEYVVECYDFGNVVDNVGILTTIPTRFISPYMMFCGKQLMAITYDSKSYVVHYDNISHVYNGRYYVIDGLIYNTLDLGGKYEGTNHGTNIISGYTIINYGYDYMIVFNNKTRIVNCIKNSEEDTGTYPIGLSYYSVENLSQYHNYNWTNKWTIGDHRLFGKYVDEYVKVILWCYKCGNVRKWIPKGVLYLIIQFAL